MDYRYFPEPDLPPLVILPHEIERVRAGLPELPEARKVRCMQEYGLSEYEAGTILQEPAFAEYFETVARLSGNGKQAGNWMLGEVSRTLNDQGTTLAGLRLEPAHLAELIQLVEARTINLNTAKEVVFPALLGAAESPRQIVARLGLAQVADRGVVDRLVQEVLAGHPTQVAQLREGNEKLRGFLVGQIMKAGKGKVDPKLVNEALAAALASPLHD